LRPWDIGKNAGGDEPTLKSVIARHNGGVLMPEEYDLHRFHEWVRTRHTARPAKP